MMQLTIAFAAGAFGGVLSFWGMFALAEWVCSEPEEPKQAPRVKTTIQQGTIYEHDRAAIPGRA